MLFNFMERGYMVGGVWIDINMGRYITGEILDITIKKQF